MSPMLEPTLQDLPPAIRVMLVDDHAVVREGYRRLLALEPDMRVVAEYPDADSAYEALQRQPGLAQVMVLDLSMPGRSGLDLLRRLSLRWPSLRVLVFTMHDSPAMVAQALRAGATGFVTKSSPPEDLVAAVRHVGLSGREFDVLRHLLEGASLDQIADRLGVSAKTVANHQTTLRQKLGVANAVELVRYAQQYGLMPR